MKQEISVQNVSFRPMLPDNIESILALPYGKKTLKSSKRATKLVRLILSIMAWRLLHSNPLSSAQINVETLTLNVPCFTTVKTVINTLIENDIIVMESNYSVGKKSKSYVFGSKLHNVQWRASEQKESFIFKDSKARIENKPITFDKELLDASLDYVAEKRNWSDNTKTVVDVTLNDLWDNDYSVAKTGRVFGSWAGVARELRGALLIDGEEVREVDISNCNPLLLSDFYAIECDEKIKYLQLVENGLFYEDIMKFSGCNDRALIKEYFNSWICGKRVSTPFITDYFKSNFPILHNTISIFQKYEVVEGKTVPGYVALSHRLQNIESNIVVKDLCETTDQCYSLHDGILTTAAKAEEVKVKLENIIKSKLGINPTIKIENKREELEQNTKKLTQLD